VQVGSRSIKSSFGEFVCVRLGPILCRGFGRMFDSVFGEPTRERGGQQRSENSYVGRICGWGLVIMHGRMDGCCAFLLHTVNAGERAREEDRKQGDSSPAVFPQDFPPSL
jgi:hypothetical protein